MDAVWNCCREGVNGGGGSADGVVHRHRGFDFDAEIVATDVAVEEHEAAGSRR